jgi:hypothetical protein
MENISQTDFKFLSRNSIIKSESEQMKLLNFISQKIKENGNQTQILLCLRVLTQSLTSSNDMVSIFSKNCHELSLNYCIKHDLSQFFIMLTKLIFEIYPNFEDDQIVENSYSLYILYHCCVLKNDDYSLFLKSKLKYFNSSAIQHVLKISSSIHLCNPILFFQLFEISSENEKILMRYYLNTFRVEILQSFSFSYLELELEFLEKMLNMERKELEEWIDKEIKNQTWKKIKEISQIQNDKIIFRQIKKK